MNLNRQEIKEELFDEMDKELGSYAVNLAYMQTDDETNAARCFGKLVSMGNSAPCTTYAVIGELKSTDGANYGINPGLFVGVVLHHWTLAALREAQEWFFNIASDFVDKRDSFVVVKDRNQRELEDLPILFFRYQKVASSRK